MSNRTLCYPIYLKSSTMTKFMSKATEIMKEVGIVVDQSSPADLQENSVSFVWVGLRAGFVNADRFQKNQQPLEIHFRIHCWNCEGVTYVIVLICLNFFIIKVFFNLRKLFSELLKFSKFIRIICFEKFDIISHKFIPLFASLFEQNRYCSFECTNQQGSLIFLPIGNSLLVLPVMLI